MIISSATYTLYLAEPNFSGGAKMNRMLFHFLQIVIGVFAGCISFILFFNLANKGSEFIYKIFNLKLGGLINLLYIVLIIICFPIFIFIKTRFKTFSVTYFVICFLAFIILYWFSSVWTPRF